MNHPPKVSNTPPPVTDAMIDAGIAAMDEHGRFLNTATVTSIYLAMLAARSNQEATPDAGLVEIAPPRQNWKPSDAPHWLKTLSASEWVELRNDTARDDGRDLVTAEDWVRKSASYLHTIGQIAPEQGSHHHSCQVHAEQLFKVADALAKTEAPVQEATRTVGDAELNKRLCALHARLSLCFQGAQGEGPPRRPRSFEPRWDDMDTVLDAACALDRLTSSPDTNDCQGRP